MAFLQVDYRYLRSKAYLEFVMEPAHVTWWFLRARIYRPPKNKPGNPHFVGFYNYGWLAAHCTQTDLVKDWQGLRSRGSIQNDLKYLEEQRLIESYADPEQQYPTVYLLGSWSVYEHPRQMGEMRSRSQTIEVLFADRIFLLDESEPWAEE